MASYCNNRYDNSLYCPQHRDYERGPHNLLNDNEQQNNLPGVNMEGINLPGYFQALHDVTRNTCVCALSQNENDQNPYRKHRTEVIYPRSHPNTYTHDENTDFLTYECEHKCGLGYGYDSKVHNTSHFKRHVNRDEIDNACTSCRRKEHISNESTLHKSRNSSMQTKLSVSLEDTYNSPRNMDNVFLTTDTRPPRSCSHHANQETKNSGKKFKHKTQQDKLQNLEVQRSTNKIQLTSGQVKCDCNENDKKNQECLRGSVPTSIVCRNVNVANENDSTLQNDRNASFSIGEPALYEYAKLLTEMSAIAHVEANNNTKDNLSLETAAKPLSTGSRTKVNSMVSCQKNNKPAMINSSLSLSTHDLKDPSSNSILIMSSSYKKKEIVTRNSELSCFVKNISERDKKSNELKILPPPFFCHERNHYHRPIHPETKNIIRCHNDDELAQDQQQLRTFKYASGENERSWHRLTLREQKYEKELCKQSTNTTTEYQYSNQSDVIAEEHYDYWDRESIFVSQPLQRHHQINNYNSINSSHDIHLSKSFDEFRLRGHVLYDEKKRSSSYSPRNLKRALRTSLDLSPSQRKSHSSNSRDQYRDNQDVASICLCADHENYVNSQKRSIERNYSISPIKRKGHHCPQPSNEYHDKRQCDRNIILSSQTFPPAAPPPSNLTYHTCSPNRFFRSTGKTSFVNTCSKMMTMPPPSIESSNEQQRQQINPILRCNDRDWRNVNRCNTMFEYDQFNMTYDGGLNGHPQHLRQRKNHNQTLTFPFYKGTHVITGASRVQKALLLRKNRSSHVHHNETCSRLTLPKPKSRFIKAILRKKFTWKHYPEVSYIVELNFLIFFNIRPACLHH